LKAREPEVSIKESQQTEVERANDVFQSPAPSYEDFSLGVTGGAESSSCVQSPADEDQMEVDTDPILASTPAFVTTSTQTGTSKDRAANVTLQNYAKIIKPILSASSRLGRALAELFGLLVKVKFSHFM